MLTRVYFACLRNNCANVLKTQRLGICSILSEEYSCEDAWQQRLSSPVLKDIKMNQYFVEVDKKFGTKKLASGVDIDLFANCIQNEDQLDELEHLIYRFRRTKRAVEMMDSTTYATIRQFLKFKNYDAIIRILSHRESYGIFPDSYSYNVLMDRFLSEQLYREAAHVAVLMMLQEDFSNRISCILGLYSCQMFLDECSLDSWHEKVEKPKEEDQNKKDDDDEEEVTLVRVPFIRNPWFDDHFDITNPKHLIGKTFYLIGREMDDVVGRTYQLVGLAMYEKWDKATMLMESLMQTPISSLFLSEGVEKFREELNSFSFDEETKGSTLNKFQTLLEGIGKGGRVTDGKLMASLESKLKEIPNLEKNDIEMQKKLYVDWEIQRQAAVGEQQKDADRENRLKVIQDKKEYLYWKEKLLFF